MKLTWLIVILLISGNLYCQMEIYLLEDQEGNISSKPLLTDFFHDGKMDSVNSEGLDLYIKSDSTINIVFSHSWLAGSASFHKLNDTLFVAYGYSYLPIPDIYTYAKFTAIKIDLTVTDKRFEFSVDRSFAGLPKYHPSVFDDLIEEYDKMQTDSAFTNTNWGLITSENADKIMAMSCKLMLATISGCDNCIERFKSMRKDFSLINSGSMSEDHIANSIILINYGFLPYRYNGHY